MFKKYKLLIPALVLVVLATWTFIHAGTDYSLTIQHITGLIASVICVLSFFAFKHYYKYVLGVTLLLGLINLFNFTPAETTIALSFNRLSIGFQPYSFFVIILTVILAIPEKSEVTLIQSESVSRLNQDLFKEDLEKFKRLYSAKASAELTEITESSKFTVAAKEAAKQILDERRIERGIT